eukprot:312100_1
MAVTDLVLELWTNLYFNMVSMIQRLPLARCEYVLVADPIRSNQTSVRIKIALLWVHLMQTMIDDTDRKGIQRDGSEHITHLIQQMVFMIHMKQTVIGFDGDEH